jgi:hypothetical protein
MGKGVAMTKDVRVLSTNETKAVDGASYPVGTVYALLTVAEEVRALRETLIEQAKEAERRRISRMRASAGI